MVSLTENDLLAGLGGVVHSLHHLCRLDNGVDVRRKLLAGLDAVDKAVHLLLEHVLTDNVLRKMDEGDSLAGELAGKAASSRARYPLDQVMTKAIKAYNLV